MTGIALMILGGRRQVSHDGHNPQDERVFPDDWNNPQDKRGDFTQREYPFEPGWVGASAPPLGPLRFCPFFASISNYVASSVSQ